MKVDKIKKYCFDNLLIIILELAVVICFFVVCSAINVNILQALTLTILLLGFSLWGHILLYPITYQKGDVVSGFIWGSISGIALGGLLTSVIVYIWGWNIWLIGGAIFILPCICLAGLAFRRPESGNGRVNREIDLDILLLSVLVVILFFYFPLKNAGAVRDGFVVYPWLFGHDFLARVVHIVSLAQGIPLKSFHFSGESLSYYWLAYVYPTLIYKSGFLRLDTQTILKITSLLYALLTTGGLILFLSQFVSSKGQRMFLALLVFCAYSYSGLYFFLAKCYFWLTGQEALQILGVNLFGFSGFSHTIYRFFLVQFQATLAVGMMLMVLTFFRTPNRSIYDYGIIGIISGLVFGVDATNGIMLALYLCVIAFFHMWSMRKNVFRIIGHYLLAAIGVIVVYALLFWIKMYSFETGKSVLQISPNLFALFTFPAYMLLEYGPLLVLGTWGLCLLYKNRESSDHWMYPFVFLFIIGISFMLLIKSPTEIHFGLLKATRIIPVCLIVFSAYWLQKNWNGRPHVRLIAVLLLLLAFPSLMVDAHLASDVKNPSTYLRIEDLEAAQWIRNNLPRDAVIQAYTNYPGPFESPFKPLYYYSFVPVFAERVTAFGEWKFSSQEHARSQDAGTRFHQMDTLFSTRDMKVAINILQKYNISYLYLGSVEKNLFGKGITKFLDSSCFETVYSKGDVRIVKTNCLGENT